MVLRSVEWRTFEERVFYPAHDPRKDTPEFARVRRALIHDENTTCRICGVRKTTLASKKANTAPVWERSGC